MTETETTQSAALSALRERVTVGTRFHVTNHDYIKDSGDRVVTQLYTMSDQTYRHDGETHLIRKGGAAFKSRAATGRGVEFWLQWPIDGDDYEVDGNELRIFNPSHAYVNGARAAVLTLRFAL